MKSIAVFGLSQFGYQVATSLSQKGFEVIVCDEKEDLVDEIKDLGFKGVMLNHSEHKLKYDDLEFVMISQKLAKMGVLIRKISFTINP